MATPEAKTSVLLENPNLPDYKAKASAAHDKLKNTSGRTIEQCLVLQYIPYDDAVKIAGQLRMLGVSNTVPGDTEVWKAVTHMYFEEKAKTSLERIAGPRPSGVEFCPSIFPTSVPFPSEEFLREASRRQSLANSPEIRPPMPASFSLPVSTCDQAVDRARRSEVYRGPSVCRDCNEFHSKPPWGGSCAEAREARHAV